MIAEARGVLTGFAILALALLVAISLDLGVPGQELLSTLRFHIGLVLLVLPLLLLSSGARWRAVVVLAAILVSLGQGATLVLLQQHARSQVETGQPLASFRALSFNVLGDNPQPAEAARFIADSGADVAVVMEAGGIRPALDMVEAQFPYRFGCDIVQACDLAIFSRTPLVRARMISLRAMDRMRLFQAVTTINGQDVTIVALHLTKPYYDGAARAELWQARWIINSIEGPVLLAGDFNAAAWSNNIADFAGVLDLLPPPYYPATWPVALAPFGVPIDNMFTRGGALIRDIAATPQSFGSNHLGLLATVDVFAP